MDEYPLGATAPRVTSRTPFGIFIPGQPLFEVRPGLSATEALQLASCHLAAACDVAEQCALDATGDRPERLWATYYLVDLAKAIVDAALGRVEAEGTDRPEEDHAGTKDCAGTPCSGSCGNCNRCAPRRAKRGRVVPDRRRARA